MHPHNHDDYYSPMDSIGAGNPWIAGLSVVCVLGLIAVCFLVTV